MLLSVEENIIPRFKLDAEDAPNIQKYLNEIPQMERFFTEAPLTQQPVATLARAEVLIGFEEAELVVDNYQFVITRRFTVGGELHVGGANGEVLNVYTFISNLRRFLEEQLELQEDLKRDSQ
jgi:hypothetical protein